MKRSLAVLLLGLAACVPLPPAISAASTPIPADAWVIRNGTLIDGIQAEPIPAAVVVIRGERIWAAGVESDFRIGPAVTTIDAGGGTILPGLIDAHTHYTSAAVIRQVFLHAGVTAVCDTGSSRAVMPSYADPGSPALGLAARGFRSGPMLAPPDGYPGVFFGINVNYEVSGAADARAAVADLAGRGADYIKISLEGGADGVPGLSLAETRAAVAAAHAHGLLARVHARSEAAFRQALEAGADVIEHAPVPSDAEAQAADGSASLPPELAGLLEQAAEAGVILVPTLHALTDESDRPELLLAVVRHFHQAGGSVALGNDYGTPGIPAGLPAGEMALLIQAGLSPMQLLQASTRLAAAACGQAAELGTIEPGKLADLIVVAGDPLADRGALTKPILVVLGGQIAVELPAE